MRLGKPGDAGLSSVDCLQSAEDVSEALTFLQLHPSIFLASAILRLEAIAHDITFRAKAAGKSTGNNLGVSVHQGFVPICSERGLGKKENKLIKQNKRAAFARCCYVTWIEVRLTPTIGPCSCRPLQ